MIVSIADVAAMASQGLRFLIVYGGPQGQDTVHIDPDQVPAYLQDPPGWLAAFYGIHRAEYLGWHAADFRVCCAARTRRGVRCKATVRGGNALGAREWATLERQQLMCPVHEERGVRFIASRRAR